VLPNDRRFDLYDIVANIVGSLAGLGLCSWYHQRMLERRRVRRQYNAVPGEDEDDLELGEGHETGVTDREVEPEPEPELQPEPLPPVTRTLEHEVDHWDENAMDDWPEDEDGDIGRSNGGGGGDLGDPKPV
jgi:hypothetical protein